MEKVAPPDTVAVPAVNDSSSGLARMYEDLKPGAAALRRVASVLLCFSLLVLGSPTLEGVFGLIAACGVLCCAAPGSLGTAYAARCTRICAIICAGIALFQALTLSAVAVTIPRVPQALMEVCGEEAIASLPEPFEASQKYEAEIALDTPSFSQRGADAVVFVATSAARKLHAVSGRDVDCERMAEFIDMLPPSMLHFFSFVELGLFASAYATARVAARLMSDARRFGANAL